jgi:protein TonB
MERPADRQAAPAPIEAQFLEQSAPAAPQRVEAAPPIVHPPKPATPRNERVEQKAPVQRPEATPSAPVALPAAPIEEQAKAGTDQAGTISRPASSGGARGASGPAFGGNGDQGGPGGGKGGGDGGKMYSNSGARAIIRPMPQIPDDMREEAFSFTALARFHVAADGSAKVELARPTPNPRLNRIVMESLIKWRFMPAIRDGKPVASTEEIAIKIEVK